MDILSTFPGATDYFVTDVTLLRKLENAFAHAVSVFDKIDILASNVGYCPTPAVFVDALLDG
jgi:NAD(P)-dependent dehydrogenase (short-subunit alcohol dehydrogenase family)